MGSQRGPDLISGDQRKAARAGGEVAVFVTQSASGRRESARNVHGVVPEGTKGGAVRVSRHVMRGGALCNDAEAASWLPDWDSRRERSTTTSSARPRATRPAAPPVPGATSHERRREVM